MDWTRILGFGHRAEARGRCREAGPACPAPQKVMYRVERLRPLNKTLQSQTDVPLAWRFTVTKLPVRSVGRWTNRRRPAGSLSGTSSPGPHTEAEWVPGPFRHARSSGPLFWGPCASSFPRLYAELWRAWQNDVFSMEAGRTMLDI